MRLRESQPVGRPGSRRRGVAGGVRRRPRSGLRARGLGAAGPARLAARVAARRLRRYRRRHAGIRRGSRRRTAAARGPGPAAGPRLRAARGELVGALVRVRAWARSPGAPGPRHCAKWSRSPWDEGASELRIPERLPPLGQRLRERRRLPPAEPARRIRSSGRSSGRTSGSRRRRRRARARRRDCGRSSACPQERERRATRGDRRSRRPATRAGCASTKNLTSPRRIRPPHRAQAHRAAGVAASSARASSSATNGRSSRAVSKLSKRSTVNCDAAIGGGEREHRRAGVLRAGRLSPRAAARRARSPTAR